MKKEILWVLIALSLGLAILKSNDGWLFPLGLVLFTIFLERLIDLKIKETKKD